MEWEEGLQSTAVTLLHTIWESGGKDGFMEQKQTKTEMEFFYDDLQLRTFYFVVLCDESVSESDG